MAGLGNIILPDQQPFVGPLFKMIQLNPGSGSPPSAVFTQSPSSFAHKLATASRLLSYISYENSWLSTTNANSQATPPQNYAKKNCMLRLRPRIDKSPWPHGQQYVNIVVLLNYSEAVGSNGGTAQTQSYINYNGSGYPGTLPGNGYYLASAENHGAVAYAPAVARLIQWNRNASPLTTSLQSGSTPANSSVQAQNFPSNASASVNATFSSVNHHSGIQVGSDNDPYTGTDIQLSFDTPKFTTNGTVFTPDPITPNFAQPLILSGTVWQPQALPYLSGTGVFGFQTYAVQLGWTVSQFNPPQGIGLVQTLVFTIASFGWSPEINDSGTAT